jgi:hypothetical protein
MKFRKKPVVIEAVQLHETNDSIAEVQRFIGNGVLGNDTCDRARDAWEDYLHIVKRDGGIKIKTLEGQMLASFGDFVIKGVSGEFYPCKPDIFEATYEKVDE